MAKERKTISVPVGLEQMLFAAAVDPGFHAELIRDRELAVARRGVELTASESAVLAIATDAQLAAMIDRIDTSEQNLKRRKFMRAVAATAVTLAAGTGLGACGGPGDEPAVKTDAPFQGQSQKLEIEVPPVEPAGSRPLETIPDVKLDAGAPALEIPDPELNLDGGARPDIDWENR